MKARELSFEHVGAEISWTVPNPEALLDEETPASELAWIAFDGDSVVVGIWPPQDDESEAFEEHYLGPDTEIALTVGGQPWGQS